MVKKHNTGEAQLRARLLGLLFFGGATVSLVALALPQPPTVDRPAATLLALCGYPVGALVLVFGTRWPTWMLQLILAAGTVVVTGGVLTSHGSGVGVGAAFFYVWVVLYSAHFFSLRATAVQLAWIAAVCGAAQLASGRTGAAAEWVLVMGAVVVTGVVMAAVSGRLRDAARIDALTGLPNRLVLDELLDTEIARARRANVPLSVAMVDLDHFKSVNDRQGHSAGDRLLAEVSTVWRRYLRTSDTVVRYGGDEFVIVFPGATTGHSSEVLDRLCMNTAVPASAGTAELRPSDTAATLLHRADQALLAAKAGRSTVPPPGQAGGAR